MGFDSALTPASFRGTRPRDVARVSRQQLLVRRSNWILATVGLASLLWLMQKSPSLHGFSQRTPSDIQRAEMLWRDRSKTFLSSH